MARATIPTPVPALWAPLFLYLLGYAAIGFLLSLPGSTVQHGLFFGAIVGIGVLAWAGAMRQGFVVALLGAAILAGMLLWAISLSEVKVAAASVVGALVWGMVWLTAVADEDAFPMAIMLVVLTLVAWAIKSAVFIVGVIATFICCTSPTLGDHLRGSFGAPYTFFVLVMVGELGLGLGWLLERVI